MSFFKNVVIRPSRLHMLGCWSGCSIFLSGVIIFGLQSMVALHGVFSTFAIWAYGLGVFILGLFVLWYCFEGIPSAWSQKIVLEQESLDFQDDAKERTLRYDEIEGVEMEQSAPGFHSGPGHQIVFQCRGREQETVIFRTNYFTLHSVLKMLAAISKHISLGAVRISRPKNFDNERELRRAAKGLGEVELDVDKGCYWFKPFKS